jgi:hypothetical protein
MFATYAHAYCTCAVDIKRLKILVIPSDVQAREILRAPLRSLGFEIRVESQAHSQSVITACGKKCVHFQAHASESTCGDHSFGVCLFPVQPRPRSQGGAKRVRIAHTRSAGAKAACALGSIIAPGSRSLPTMSRNSAKSTSPSPFVSNTFMICTGAGVSNTFVTRAQAQARHFSALAWRQQVLRDTTVATWSICFLLMSQEKRAHRSSNALRWSLPVLARSRDRNAFCTLLQWSCIFSRNSGGRVAPREGTPTILTAPVASARTPLLPRPLTGSRVC